MEEDGFVPEVHGCRSTGITKQPHHVQQEFCLTRPRYRQGRKLTAVKAYTVNDESKYLIVCGVQAIKIEREFAVLCQKYGKIKSVTLLVDYPTEEFVTAYLVVFELLRNARYAKRHLDGKSFFGHVLHVCYAPEMETVDDTREKLLDRRKTVAARTEQRAVERKQNQMEGHGSNSQAAGRGLTHSNLATDGMPNEIDLQMPHDARVVEALPNCSHDSIPSSNYNCESFLAEQKPVYFTKDNSSTQKTPSLDNWVVNEEITNCRASTNVLHPSSVPCRVIHKSDVCYKKNESRRYSKSKDRRKSLKSHKTNWKSKVSHTYKHLFPQLNHRNTLVQPSLQVTSSLKIRDDFVQAPAKKIRLLSSDSLIAETK